MVWVWVLWSISFCFAMLAFKSTARLQEFLKFAADHESLPSESRERALRLQGESSLPWRALEELCSAVRSAGGGGGEGPWLHKICVGAVFDLEAPKPRQKSPELIKRLEELQGKLDDQVYRKMVGGVARREFEAQQDFSLLPTFQLQASFGIQVILTMAVFYMLGNAGGKAVSEEPVVQALAGVGGLVFALILETVLWIIRSSESKVPEALKKKRRPLKETTQAQKKDQ